MSASCHIWVLRQSDSDAIPRQLKQQHQILSVLDWTTIAAGLYGTHDLTAANYASVCVQNCTATEEVASRSASTKEINIYY